MIVKGCVKITETVHNHVFNTLDTVEHCILGEKKSFGKSAVMFNSRRLTSVQSLGKNLYTKYVFIFITNIFDKIKSNH